LTNTTFKTVHGLDAPGQFSTARDMALLGKALIHDVPDEYAIHKEKEFTFNKSASRTATACCGALT
jgi:D-alanyl-D-alanine carboxypeptidase (penicillin-binding protein 5/6)